MKYQTRSFRVCAFIVAFSVFMMFPGNLWGGFMDKEDLKTVGIIAGITLGVGVALVLIAGTVTDLKKIFKKDSAWLPDEESMKFFSGTPSGNGAIYLEGIEVTARESGPDIDLLTGWESPGGRLLMPPLAALHDPILLRPRFEAGFETLAPLSRPLDQ